MRYLAECIKDVADEDDRVGEALCYLMAEQIAAQALTVAFETTRPLDKEAAHALIERIAGYPSVTARKMRSDTEITVGHYATERLLTLARMKQGFVVEK